MIVILALTESIFLIISMLLKKWLQQIILNLLFAKNYGKVLEAELLKLLPAAGAQVISRSFHKLFTGL